jgi:predicted O-methyltransferase YrrM
MKIDFVSSKGVFLVMNEQLTNTLSLIEEYAKLHHVPIMEKEGIDLLSNLLVEKDPDRVLEIGAAIGFSAIRMASALPACSIDTIERDEHRFTKALEFIHAAGLDSQIRIFHEDALEMDLALLERDYDAIFIDAAKGQYERFFDKYESLLKKGGAFYCDNMHMHGMTQRPLSEVPKRKRTMIRNLKAFRETMLNHPAYETVEISECDGIMICTKKD